MENIGIMAEGDKKQAFTSLLLELQVIVDATIDCVLGHYGKTSLAASSWAGIIILKRLIESTKAAQLLIAHGFERDASILLTNQIELRLDIQYIAQDHTRARTWLTHATSHSKPWKVRFLFEQLYEKEELKAEKEVYMRFSMVKHGNPVAETFGFPLAIKDGHLLAPSQDDVLLGKFSIITFALFKELFKSYKAAVAEFRRCHLDLSEQENKADFINFTMHDLNEKSFYEQVQLLLKISPKHDLCDTCKAFPKNVIEVTCLIHRMEHAVNFTCERYVPA
jgi:hypothetical protein